MLSRLTRLFRKPSAPAPVMPEALPAHRGFVATYRIANTPRVESETFPTLRDAQIWLMKRRQFAREWDAGLAAHGVNRPAPVRRYSIRNMETGKFAPFMFALSRADLA